ncbi:MULTISPECIES: peptide-methionine (R)-S-oxide reductase MsrB [unclassified Campylobacter]|uniref:peptide-methionine (R)-S-oxide reductase MsrB n=1 Tax=unclassified Campylobacter TaxID=2593542 RepID=UPI0022E9C53F|nr:MULTISPECIES: peptide-methionine (R)-S-oxide reductase MsrB [unclassified Campylobacter]MDA3042665.1 peptide-methionine (R)-S-oxide reductase MsrB [Campylobacter sp. JMF_09 ED2]MDA3044521.1 peptide-methionine (R)-S-oxide reductase MsrB [Campylobacter sp. JMF_07 ED4]MDA3071498.1 peptide-methionine (R)-S-oxide reductase MsrB [Campylobacter sp. VBCF_03 NA9]MDA3074438.1 peptide-methionine (R)-S-oxide reductase MsrB [Campylobacter sp. JMF_05 ED3]
MKILKFLLCFALFLGADEINLKGESVQSKNQNLKEIYLAGGCFWGMEGYFRRVKGVASSEVGYANGNSKKTDYYSLKNTDHAETLKIKFDENVVAFAEILEHFFRVIDPVSVDKQGNDVGRQYRTGIYYTNESDREFLQNFIALKQKKYKEKIAVEVAPLHNYARAEEYHQNYLGKNPNGYCHIDLNLASKPLYDESGFALPSPEEIKENLTPLQFSVTQEKATERPYTSEFDKLDAKGIYIDVVTKKPLFSSTDKFNAGCGWPSFSKPITTDALDYARDTSHGMVRTEVSSRLGGAHLGHVFEDGIKEKGGLRYCINGASLEFIPLEKMSERGYGEFIPYVK